MTPWTQAQVDALNKEQQRQDRHPYTCGNNSRHRVLVATIDGWICQDCDYKQNWAHGLLPAVPPDDECITDEEFDQAVEEWADEDENNGT